MAGLGTSSINAGEYKLADVFGPEFRYRIPPYQRPYAWEASHAVALVEDIDEARDVLPDYFLGSLVLVESEDDDGLYDVIDGQQRLTTLTLLWAVLMHLLPDDEAEELRSFIWQKAQKFKNKPKSVRLRVPDDVNGFFAEHVQSDDGITSLLATDAAKLENVPARYRANAAAMHDVLVDRSPEELADFAIYLAQHVYLVSVVTSHFDAAYRIFSVMNDRGLELTASDILKAEVIGRIDEDERPTYAETWGEVENELGRDLFSDLFAHLRMIHLKRKAQTTILDELRDHVVPNYEPTDFVDDIVAPYGETLLRIDDGAWQASERQFEINRLLRWLGEIDNFDWVPPTLEFFQRNDENPELLHEFLIAIDRLSASMFLRRTYLQTRLKRYGKVLDVIDDPDRLLTDDGPMVLSPSEQKETIEVLNGDVYGSRITKYVVRRLEAHLADASAEWQHKLVSIEHVLPQTPAEGSKWREWFTDAQRIEWTHRIANLVPLNRQRNSQANNYELDKKLNAYFKVKGESSPFVLTNEILGHEEWTPAILGERQKRLVGELCDLWKLDEAARGDDESSK